MQKLVIIFSVLFSIQAMAVKKIICEDRMGEEKAITLFNRSVVEVMSFEDYPELGFDDCVYSTAYIHDRFGENMLDFIEDKETATTRFMAMCSVYSEWASDFILLYRSLTPTLKYTSYAGVGMQKDEKDFIEVGGEKVCRR